MTMPGPAVLMAQMASAPASSQALAIFPISGDGKGRFFIHPEQHAVAVGIGTGDVDFNEIRPLVGHVLRHFDKLFHRPAVNAGIEGKCPVRQGLPFRIHVVVSGRGQAHGIDHAAPQIDDRGVVMAVPGFRADGFHGHQTAPGPVNPLQNPGIVSQNAGSQGQGGFQGFPQKRDRFHQLNLS
jgi:hypothetical protein